MEKKNFWVSVAAVVVVLFAVIALSWLVTGVNIFSPGNVVEQWRSAYQSIEALEAQASNACTAAAQAAAGENADERVQRRSQQAAFEQNYNRIKAAYDAKMNNNFEAGLVRPADLPQQAPTLGEMRRRVCTE